jgi:hypothetical protein
LSSQGCEVIAALASIVTAAVFDLIAEHPPEDKVITQ